MKTWRRLTIPMSWNALVIILLSACAPAVTETDPNALELARAASMPIVIDDIRVHKGSSNDTYFLALISAVDGQMIRRLAITAQAEDASGKALVPQPRDMPTLKLQLDTPFDDRHIAQWGPFFMGPTAHCLNILAIEVSTGSGTTTHIAATPAYRAATRYTVGQLCN